jgi:hypothetical protein
MPTCRGREFGPYGKPDQELVDYSQFSSNTDWIRVKQRHMANLFRCITEGAQPISDVQSAQRSTTTCHLANMDPRKIKLSTCQLAAGRKPSGFPAPDGSRRSAKWIRYFCAGPS